MKTRTLDNASLMDETDDPAVLLHASTCLRAQVEDNKHLGNTKGFSSENTSPKKKKSNWLINNTENILQGKPCLLNGKHF